MASTSRYPVVMENSCMSVGKVMFMAVSMTTPVNDSSPAAMMERKKRRSAQRSNGGMAEARVDFLTDIGLRLLFF